MTARAGTGLVSVRRVRGIVTVRTEKGDVILDDVQGLARITALEGDIRGTHLAGDELDGFAASGIVSLSYAQTPGRVWVRTTVFAGDGKPAATMLLNLASIKQSYARYEEEYAGLYGKKSA